MTYQVGDLVRPRDNTSLSLAGVPMTMIWRVIESHDQRLVITPVFGLFGTNKKLSDRQCLEADVQPVDAVALGNEFAALSNFITRELAAWRDG